MIIKLHDLFCTDTLRHRETARKVVELIVNDKSNKIIIDFSEIEFASRSFLHELICGIDDRNVAFVHTVPEVSQMMEIIQKSAVSTAC